MLAEKEFFIRKAIGWVLRETAKKDPAYVAAWTRSHLAQMSGVTFPKPSAGYRGRPRLRPTPPSSRTRFSVVSV